MKAVVVIPAYNPPVSFYELIELLGSFSFVDKLVIVDDGSEKKLNVLNQKCILLKHTKNMGKGAALKTAFSYLVNQEYDKVVLLDSDLKVNKENLEDFLKNLFSNNNKIFIGFPVNVRKKGFGIVKGFAKFVVRIYTGKVVEHSLSGQRIIPFSAIRKIKHIPKRYGVDVSILIDFLKEGYEVVEVPFDFTHNEKGKNVRDLVHKLYQLKDIFIVFITKHWR